MIQETEHPDVLLTLITVPNRETAERIADELLQRKLAACVNIIPGITSHYRWQDKLERDTELLLIVKTTHAVFDELRDAVIKLHPYDLPEIIGINVVRGMEEYLKWVIAEVKT